MLLQCCHRLVPFFFVVVIHGVQNFFGLFFNLPNSATNDVTSGIGRDFNITCLA
jgi:hypothetical protein